MSIPTVKPLDQAAGQATEAAPVPRSPVTRTEHDPASATTKMPAMVPVNAEPIKDHQQRAWIRDLKPAEPSAKDVPGTKETPKRNEIPNAKEAPTTTALPSSPPSFTEKTDQKAGVKLEQDQVEYDEVSAKPRPSFKVCQLVSRPSPRGNISIQVCIGKIPEDLPTDEGWFPTILDVINRYTIQKPYACDTSQMLDVGDAIVFRPIHNVTHSVRQVMLLRTLFDCLSIHGTHRVQKILSEISPTERLLLRLGSFCLRVGRVDETNTHHPFPDSNGRKYRSAQIFALYASQLPSSVAPRDEIEWVASLIGVACTPDEALPKVITDNDKSYLAVQLLASAHELDLYRCYNTNAMQEPIQKVKQFLFIQTDDVAKANDIYTRLENYALALMAATGSAISYENRDYDLALFGANSLDAKYCWQSARRVDKPSW